VLTCSLLPYLQVTCWRCVDATADTDSCVHPEWYMRRLAISIMRTIKQQYTPSGDSAPTVTDTLQYKRMALHIRHLHTVVKVARSSRRAQGTESSMGWGIWHNLCIKEQFFINSRGLKPEQGGSAPLPPHFNYCLHSTLSIASVKTAIWSCFVSQVVF